MNRDEIDIIEKVLTIALDSLESQRYIECAVVLGLLRSNVLGNRLEEAYSVMKTPSNNHSSSQQGESPKAKPVNSGG